MAEVNGHQASELTMQLLSRPEGEEEENFSKPLKRGGCSYEDRCKRFLVKERLYRQQYASLYFVRLTKMRKMVEAAALSKWGRMKCARI